MTLLIKNEFKHLWQETKTYKLDSIMSNVDILILCLGIFFGIAQNMFVGKDSGYVLIGMILWWATITSISTATEVVRKEVVVGTINQLIISKYSLSKIILARLVANICFESIQMLVVSLIIAVVFKVNIPSDMNYLLLAMVIVLTMVGIVGIGFIFAGLTLVFKRTEAIAMALNNYLLFFTGLVVPLSVLPSVFVISARIFPFYWGMEIIEHNVISLNLLAFLLCSALWCYFGNLIFKACFTHLQTNGNTSY